MDIMIKSNNKIHKSNYNEYILMSLRIYIFFIITERNLL